MNAATLQAVISLLQCLSAKGEQKQYEKESLDWSVPLMMISAAMFWLYMGYRGQAAVLAWCRSWSAVANRTCARSTQTDDIPVPAVERRFPADVVRLPRMVFISTRAGRCYNVDSRCSGLSNANDVISRRVCLTCCGIRG